MLCACPKWNVLRAEFGFFGNGVKKRKCAWSKQIRSLPSLVILKRGEDPQVPRSLDRNKTLCQDGKTKCMDPRIAWCGPEHLGPSHNLWTRVWEAQLGVVNMNLNNANPNLEQKAQEYISLDYTNKFDHKQGNTNKQNNLHNQQYHRRKKDNKASTYGLNHSSNVHLLRKDGGLTPWKPKNKIYPPTMIG